MSDESDALLAAIQAYQESTRLLDQQDINPAITAPGGLSQAERTQIIKQLRWHARAINDMNNVVITPLSDVLSALLPWLSGVDPVAPAVPTNLSVTALSDDSVTLDWDQSGTVAGWYVYLRKTTEAFPNVPAAHILFADGSSETLSLPQASTQYVAGIAAYNDSGIVSSLAPIQFTSDATAGTRAVEISSAMKTTALAAEAAAANGAKDAAYTASLLSTLGASPLGVIVDRDTNTDLHTEVVTLSSSAAGITIAAAAASFTSSSAADPAAYDNLWLEIRKSGSPSVKISIPAGASTQPDALYVISGAWTAGQQVQRTAAYLLAMPHPAFDTATPSSVSDLVADMSTAFEAAPMQHVFGNMSGPAGILVWVRPTVKGFANFADFNGLNINANCDLMLPWFVFTPGYDWSYANDWLISAYGYDCGVMTADGVWHYPAGYPTNSVLPAFYSPNSALNSSGAGTWVDLGDGRTGTYLSTSTGGDWVMHNNVGSIRCSQMGFAATDVSFVAATYKHKMVPIPGQGMPAGAKQPLMQCGVDAYPDGFPGGYITPAIASTLRKSSTSEGKIGVCNVKPSSGLLTIATPYDASLLSTYPKADTILLANPPRFYS